MSRRGKLDQRQDEDVAGLNRFALLVLAGQPCQPQLVMHPHQRVRLHSLLMIGHDKLGAPRPVSRVPPLKNHPSARQSGGVYRSLTVVVLVPSFAVRVVVTHSMRAPPCAPSSIRASDSNVRIAPARVVTCENCNT